VPFLLIPAALSMTINTGLMYVFPARRLREILLLVGTLMFLAVVVVFRLMEPERLVNPEDEMQVIEFLKMMAVPSAPYLPSAWAANAVLAASNVDLNPFAYWINLAWLWLGAGVMWAMALVLAGRWYGGAWQQASEALGVRGGVRLARNWLPVRAGPYLSILLKDVKVFMREPSQWGQMLLLGALVFIYIFNVSKIPLGVWQGLRGLLFFVNLGLIGMLLVVVAARFLFPLVSLEAGSFELLRIAPISMERYLWTRLMGGVVPLLVLAIALVGFSLPLLRVDRFMSTVAVFSVAAMTITVSALAGGCGASFAKFRISNPEESVTSAGGFIYMGLATAYIVGVLVIESQPVRTYYWATLFGRPFTGQLYTAGAIGVVAVVSAVCVYASITSGARSLAAREL